MFVCLCQGITEHQWQEALGQASTLEEAMTQTGAGLQCGSCRAWLTLAALPRLELPIIEKEGSVAGLAQCPEVPHSADTRDCEDFPE